MPNWCSNEVILTGPKDVIDEIAATNLSLDILFPCPKELKDTVAPAKYNAKEKAEENIKNYGYADWYDWQVNNWGTKWDITPYNPIVVEPLTDGLYEISVGFDSAWAPPVKAMEKLYHRYKDRGLNVWMEYFEGGCAFIGTCKSQDGDFVDDCREFSNSDELEDAIKDLDHNMGQFELDYLREREEEERQSEIEEESKAQDEKPAKATKRATKKSTVKKPAIKKAVKKPAAKKVAKKPAAKKVAKKPAPKKASKKTPTKKPATKKVVKKIVKKAVKKTSKV